MIRIKKSEKLQSGQASDPYVMMLHTLDLYNLSRRFRCSRLSAQMCRILPNRCLAVAILIFTSVMQPPPASNIESRYFVRHAFVVSLSPHLTLGSSYEIYKPLKTTNPPYRVCHGAEEGTNPFSNGASESPITRNGIRIRYIFKYA